MKLTIDRSRWIRGADTPSRLLHASDQKMCCLGFYCLAKGVEPDAISGISSPGWMNSETFKVPELLISHGFSSDIARQLMLYNDNEDISPQEREANITSLMKEIGCEVEFIN